MAMKTPNISPAKVATSIINPFENPRKAPYSKNQENNNVNIVHGKSDLNGFQRYEFIGSIFPFHFLLFDKFLVFSPIGK